MKTFLDSSAFAKRFVEEAGSQQVEDICAEATALGLSVICVPEIISVMNRRLREGLLSKPQYESIKRRLSDEIRDAVILNITPAVVRQCISVLESSVMRAMDAIHVACAVEWKAGLFVSGDERQVTAAERAGLRTRRV